MATAYPTIDMPCIRNSDTRAQQAFAPLIVRCVFCSEVVLPSQFPTLLWRETFPLHVEGVPPADSTPSSTISSPVPTYGSDGKLKRPSGERSRKQQGRGFQLKETLNLPDGLYEEIVVSDFKTLREELIPYNYLRALFTIIVKLI